MKTSIIVSTFAALCLMVTLGKAPTTRKAERNNVTSVSNYYYKPSTTASAKSALKAENSTKKEAEVKTTLPSVEDLSYLKFEVADYMTDNDMAIEMNPENSLDYLKFDVSDYTDNTELTSPDAIELPVNEFAKLKFDVTEYTASTELTDFDTIELPVDEFSYLKFDVNKYVSQNSTDTINPAELPVSE